MQLGEELENLWNYPYPVYLEISVFKHMLFNNVCIDPLMTIIPVILLSLQ